VLYFSLYLKRQFNRLFAGRTLRTNLTLLVDLISLVTQACCALFYVYIFAAVVNPTSLMVLIELVVQAFILVLYPLFFAYYALVLYLECC
jgi:hypothetical protein